MLYGNPKRKPGQRGSLRKKKTFSQLMLISRMITDVNFLTSETMYRILIILMSIWMSGIQKILVKWQLIGNKWQPSFKKPVQRVAKSFQKYRIC